MKRHADARLQLALTTFRPASARYQDPEDSLGQIKEQMAFLGNPEYVCGLLPVDFAMMARGFWLDGQPVSDPKRVQQALASTLSASGPALLVVEIDQNDPSCRPRSNRAKALLEDTAGRDKILGNAAKEAIREIV